MRYIILSEKDWNADLHEKLNNTFGSDEFNLINNPNNLEATIDNFKPDKIFIPHWSHFIKPEIYEKYECIVFHMTDLPYGRGGSPLQNLIVRGKTETKISALRVVKELDAGAIYLKEDLELYGTAQEIYFRANSIIESMIENIIENKLTPLPQEGKAVNFKRRSPEMSNIIQTDTIDQIYNFIRMLDADGYPHAYIETEFLKLEFTGAKVESNNTLLAYVRIIKK